MKAFLKQLADEFDISPSGTHVAVVAYSTNPQVVFKFNTLQGSQLNTVEVKKLLDSIPLSTRADLHRQSPAVRRWRNLHCRERNETSSDQGNHRFGNCLEKDLINQGEVKVSKGRRRMR